MPWLISSTRCAKPNDRRNSPLLPRPRRPLDSHHTADQIVGREFINNDNFSSGNTGFTTDYVHAPGTNGLYPAATYAINANPGGCHGAFAGCDHTSGSGNFMIVNGAANRLVDLHD